MNKTTSTQWSTRFSSCALVLWRISFFTPILTFPRQGGRELNISPSLAGRAGCRKILKNLFAKAIVTLIFVMSIPLTASSNAIGDADRQLFIYIHEDMENRFLDVTTPFIQRMGETQVCLGVSAILCAFGNERMFETGKLGAAAFMEAGFVMFTLKKIVGRPRPLDEDRTETDSFPSGHTTFAFAMATVAGHQYPELRIPFYIAALGTAFSRIYLGRHYPSDVMAGAAIGILTGVHIIYYKKPILKFSF